MKRYLLIISLIIVSALTLAACATPVNVVTEEINNLLSDSPSANALAKELQQAIEGNQNIAEEAPQTQNSDTAVNETISLGTTSEVLAAYQGALEEIYQRVNPQVVNISVLVEQPAGMSGIPGFGFPGIPGAPEDNTPPDSQEPFYGHGAGSGFVWDKEGHIVTNNHVVKDAVKIEVTFADGTTVPAELVGADPDSDLAVLKVDVAQEKLHPVQLADPDSVKVGQLAIAIGNPFGLEGTMTVGIVSAMGRSIPATEGFTNGPVYSIPEIIQTDAPINPGNSGGVLVDGEGKVIGVTAAIESPVRANAGIGFAIPVSIVEKVVPVLIEEGDYPNPYLGISGLSLTPALSEAMDLDANQRGALVIDVVPGSPADKAGLIGSFKQTKIDGQAVKVGGDVIVAIDDVDVRDMDDLIAYLTTKTVVGQKVTLKVIRDGKVMEVKVKLGARPEEQVMTSAPEHPQKGKAKMGIMATDMTPQIAEAMGLPSDQNGVLVVQVEAGSPADEAGLHGSYKPLDFNGKQIMVGGDVIIKMDGDSIDNLAQLHSWLSGAEPGQKVELTILRDGKEMQLILTLGEHS
jgi:S1-C subfamily serine protease